MLINGVSTYSCAVKEQWRRPVKNWPRTHHGPVRDQADIVSGCICTDSGSSVAVSEVVSPDSPATVAPPVIISPIASTSACEGAPACFQCKVRGDGKKYNFLLSDAEIFFILKQSDSIAQFLVITLHRILSWNFIQTCGHFLSMEFPTYA